MLSLHRSSWNPWKDLARLQHDMNRLFQTVPRDPRRMNRGAPPVNVWKGEDGVVVTALLPGLNLEDIDLSVLKDTLTIRVQPAKADESPQATVHRRESSVEPFVRTIVLPFEVESQKTEAKYDKGVLTVKLHRPESLKPTKVTVHAA